MDAFETILTRRSIRKFTAEIVSDSAVRTLMESAMAAPSAGNQQPWHFVLVTDRTMLDAITRVHPYAQMLHEAPLAILVCADLSEEKHEGMWVQDCSAATQNILLAAHAQGLGAVWLGVHPRPDRINPIRELFKLPQNVMPFCLIAIGHPAESKGPSHRFKEERIHHERF